MISSLHLRLRTSFSNQTDEFVLGVLRRRIISLESLVPCRVSRSESLNSMTLVLYVRACVRACVRP